jgi:anti-anti-sigma factor
MDDKEVKQSYFKVAGYQGVNSKDIYTVFTPSATSLSGDIAISIRSDVKEMYTNGSIDAKVNGQGNVAVDLGNVTSIDSSGLSTLLVINRLNKNKYGKDIKLANCRHNIYKLIQIAGLESVLYLVPSLDEL